MYTTQKHIIAANEKKTCSIKHHLQETPKVKAGSECNASFSAKWFQQTKIYSAKAGASRSSRLVVLAVAEREPKQRRGKLYLF
jgi:hypothetical protein